MLVQEPDDTAVLTRAEFIELLDREYRSPSGILSRASNRPVLVRSLTSMSTVPDTGLTVLASLSMWSQPAGSLSPPTM